MCHLAVDLHCLCVLDPYVVGNSGFSRILDFSLSPVIADQFVRLWQAYYHETLVQAYYHLYLKFVGADNYVCVGVFFTDGSLAMDCNMTMLRE